MTAFSKWHCLEIARCDDQGSMLSFPIFFDISSHYTTKENLLWIYGIGNLKNPASDFHLNVWLKLGLWNSCLFFFSLQFWWASKKYVLVVPSKRAPNGKEQKEKNKKQLPHLI